MWLFKYIFSFVIISTVDVTLGIKFLSCPQDQQKNMHTLNLSISTILFTKKNCKIIHKLLHSKTHLTKKNRRSVHCSQSVDVSSMCGSSAGFHFWKFTAVCSVTICSPRIWNLNKVDLVAFPPR